MFAQSESLRVAKRFWERKKSFLCESVEETAHDLVREKKDKMNSVKRDPDEEALKPYAVMTYEKNTFKRISISLLWDTRIFDNMLTEDEAGYLTGFRPLYSSKAIRIEIWPGNTANVLLSRGKHFISLRDSLRENEFSGESHTSQEAKPKPFEEMTLREKIDKAVELAKDMVHTGPACKK